LVNDCLPIKKKFISQLLLKLDFFKLHETVNSLESFNEFSVIIILSYDYDGYVFEDNIQYQQNYSQEIK
jgi:hypothetical protein